MKGDRHSWALPGGGRLILRELGPEELDDLAIQAARRSQDDPTSVSRREQQLALVRSLVEVDGRRVSSEYTSEELYHSLTARERKLAALAWRSVHIARESLVEAVLASRERLDGEPARYRWQINADALADLALVIEALEGARDNGDDVGEQLDAARDRLAEQRTAGLFVLREVLVGEVDRIGDDARKRHATDPWRRASEELRDAIAVSIVTWRGEAVADGLAVYRGLSPAERDVVQRCWHSINDVDNEEAVDMLGSHEATR